MTLSVTWRTWKCARFWRRENEELGKWRFLEKVLRIHLWKFKNNFENPLVTLQNSSTQASCTVFGSELIVAKCAKLRSVDILKMAYEFRTWVRWTRSRPTSRSTYCSLNYGVTSHCPSLTCWLANGIFHFEAFFHQQYQQYPSLLIACFMVKRLAQTNCT